MGNHHRLHTGCKQSRHLGKRLLSAIAIVAVALPAWAADVSGLFNQLTYRKAAPGQLQNNIRLVEQYVLPTQQARVDAGELQGWSYFIVRYPAGGDYDVIAVSQVDDYAKLAPGPGFRRAFDTVHGADAWDTFIGEIGPSSSVVRTEIWEQTRAVGGTGPDPFVQVNFLKVGGPAQQQVYEGLLSDYATAFWTERLKTVGVSWGTYVLHQPGAAASPYNHATSFGFAEFADTAPRTDFAEVFARAHPGVDIQDIGPRFGDVTTQVRQELWDLVFATE